MSNLLINMLTSYMDVNFNKYSDVSFLKFVCTVFISSKNHIQVLNRSSKAGAALAKTITSIKIIAIILYRLGCDIQKHCPDRKERSENNMSRSFYDILNEITDASRNLCAKSYIVDFTCVPSYYRHC